MSKTKKYATILSNYILGVAERYKNAKDGYQTLAIIDKERNHYQSLIHGFHKDTYAHTFTVQFHFDIIKEQIWIQCNNTDVPVEEELLNLGVPKSDIVFGWLPEYARAHSSWGKAA